MPKLKTLQNGFNGVEYTQYREIGQKNPLGFQDVFYQKLYSSFYEPKEQGSNSYINQGAGGIFNLEFSENGSFLVAACEAKSILIMDAFNRKLITAINNAHKRCVNNIRFIDSKVFATCSDDGTIKLWDSRFLKSETRVLQGHTYWVKNIEYSSKENLLVTSSFDGSIYAWDLNNYTENNVIHNRVFIMDGLMRTRLSPDCNKMIICTTSGYILLIHDLNLSTLNADFNRFRPNLYRLMQISEQTIPSGTAFNYLFSTSRKQNRVELISDFPNEAEVISSLQIHPQGWCALTRNINCDELSEWTSVHDIQDRSPEEHERSFKIIEEPDSPDREQAKYQDSSQVAPYSLSMDIWQGFLVNRHLRISRVMTDRMNLRTERFTVSVINSDIVLSENVGGDAPSSSTSRTQSYRPVIDPEPTDRRKIIQNLPRLTHFIQEPIEGKGYIKELCFSPEGRVICSPHNNGCRLLTFNQRCDDLSACVPDRPTRLSVFDHFTNTHPCVVVSSKFSPRHNILVTGCLGGQIVWYYPVY